MFFPPDLCVLMGCTGFEYKHPHTQFLCVDIIMYCEQWCDLVSRFPF